MGKIIGEQMASEEQVGSGGAVLETFIKENKNKSCWNGGKIHKRMVFFSHLMVSQIIVSKESTTPWNSRRGHSLSWLMGVADKGCIALTRRGRCYL